MSGAHPKTAASVWHWCLTAGDACSRCLVLCECRGYSDKKITENIDAEIARVCLDEAQSSWPEQMVIELVSENADQLESNAQRTLTWIENHCKQNGIALK